MIIKISVLISYFLIILLIGYFARSRWNSTPQSYFLADRKLGTLILAILFFFPVCRQHSWHV